MNTKLYNFCPFCGNRMEVKIEEEKERRCCSICKWTHYPQPAIAIAGIAIREFQRSVLMVKRNREPFKGTWMFPAGFLEPEEHPRDTLVREVMEETGLKVISSRFYTIELAISDPRNENHIVVFYLMSVSGNLKNNDADENSDLEWKLIDSEFEIGFPHHRKIFDLIRSGI